MGKTQLISSSSPADGGQHLATPFSPPPACRHAPTRSRGCICVPREQNPGLSSPTSRHRAGSCVLSPGYA